jgi:Pyridine nucleotide-disulphide oxidoreductase
VSLFYAAGPPEAQLCGAERVAVVGGGNSAGQAVVWLARGGALVTLVRRRADLRETMSDYLIHELERYGVAIGGRSEIAELHGADGELEAVRLGSGERLPLLFLFLFLGARPCTEWLDDVVTRDESGFILTGGAAGAEYLLESTIPASLQPVKSASALRLAHRRHRREQIARRLLAATANLGADAAVGGAPRGARTQRRRHDTRRRTPRSLPERRSDRFPVWRVRTRPTASQTSAQSRLSRMDRIRSNASGSPRQASAQPVHVAEQS